MPAYATTADLLARYPEEDLAQLTDPAGEEVDGVRVDQALVDASSEIDGYLQGRYSLPLVQAPKVLTQLCCDMAMYRLMTLRPTGDVEDARERYNDAIRFLSKVSKGEVQLGVSDADLPASQTTGPEIVTGSRTFTRDSMKGL